MKLTKPFRVASTGVSKVQKWPGWRRPTWWLAVGLVAIGVADILAWFHWKGGFRSWTPNITVGAFAAAVTITIIDRAIRREERHRLKPRTDDVVYWMGLGFRGLVSAVAVDYASTHIDSFKPLPASAIALFQQWTDEQAAEDHIRPAIDGEEHPMLVIEGIEFAKTLDRARERDREVLQPDLIHQMDEFRRSVNSSTWATYWVDKGHDDDRNGAERLALAEVVGAALEFTKVFKKYAPRWMEVPEITRKGAQAHRDRVHRVRDRPNAFRRHSD